MQNVLENNVLIAEFMGVKDGYFPQFGRYISSTSMIYSDDFEEDEYKYDSSWDWLMPVVEKIEYMLHDDLVITIQYKTCLIPVVAGAFNSNDDGFDIECDGGTKIEAVYNAVVEFIKWYNQNKKQ